MYTGHSIRELLSSNTHLATMRVLTVLRHWVTKHPEVSLQHICVTFVGCALLFDTDFNFLCWDLGL